MLALFLAQMERFARLAFALAGTHPGTETVPRTVSMLRITLFESLYCKKRAGTLVLALFLAQMERFARLAFALAGTHPGTETVPRTVSMLRITLFESLYCKKRAGTLVLALFLAQMERFELSRRLPTLRP